MVGYGAEEYTHVFMYICAVLTEILRSWLIVR